MLGPLAVLVGGQELDMGRPQAQLVLAHLLADHGRPVARDALIDRIWPDGDPKRAAHALNVHIAELRKRLRKAPGVSIDTTGDGYRLSTNQGVVDAERFRSLRAEGTLVALEAAHALWRGPAFGSLADRPGLQAVSARLERERRDSLFDLLDRRLGMGRLDGLVDEIEALVDADPYDERLWTLLLRALYASGRRRDALDAYRRVSTLLGEELGIEPGPELKELEEAILLHDERLRTPLKKSEHPLPAERFQLIGRTTEIEGIRRRIAHGRVVTIVGAAGSGKTRLAVRLAHLLADDVRVLFVPLGQLTDPDQVIAQVASVLELSDTRGETVADAVEEALRTQPTVLVLDNCEHLIGAVARLVDTLAERCPDLVTLATSREFLDVAGEDIWRLEPLRTPPADEHPSSADEYPSMALFVERARSMRPDFDPDGHLEALASICRRLDGLPLALELAAARITSMTPEEIAAGLDDRFGLLNRGRRLALDRHRTLAAAVDWSHRLLEHHERLLLERLAVFAGDFDAPTAARVCSHPPLVPQETSDLLARLVEQSMIVADEVDGTTRYRLLETIRDFGWNRLVDAGAHADMVDAYIGDHLERAAEMEQRGLTDGWLEAFEWAKVSHENVADVWHRLTDNGEPRRALWFASTLARLMSATGRARAAIRWVSEGVDSAEGIDGVTAKALTVLTMGGDDTPERILGGRRAYDYYIETANELGAAWAAYALAIRHCRVPDADQAAHWAATAAELARGAESDVALAWILARKVVLELAAARLAGRRLLATVEELDVAGGLARELGNPEVSAATATSTMASRLLLGDSNPMRSGIRPGWFDGAPSYISFGFDFMRAACLLHMGEPDAAVEALALAGPAMLDLPDARRAGAKLLASAESARGNDERAAGLIRAVGDMRPVLLYGTFHDPRPHLRRLGPIDDTAPTIDLTRAVADLIRGA